MARVRYLDKAQAGPLAAPIYDQLQERLGKVLNPHRVLAHSPELLRDWWSMMLTLLYRLQLSPKLRELAILRVFQLAGCDYCWAEHQRVARDAGVTPQQIADLHRADHSPAFDPLERLALRAAESITRDNRIEDDVFDCLSHLLPERELVELVFCIANWNGVARFIVPMALELEPPRGD